MEFYDRIEKLLENNELEECKELIYSTDNSKHLHEFSWDLASLFCNHLNKSIDNEPLVATLVDLSKHLCANYGSAKELFLIYLENSEYFLKEDDSNYFHLIDLLTVILDRLSIKFVLYSLELAINELLKYIKKTLSKIRNENCELNDVDIERANKLINKLIDLVELFVYKEIENERVNEQANTKLKEYLTNIMINLYNEPYLYVDFSSELDNNNVNVDLKSTSSSIKLLNRIYKLVNLFNKDLFKLFVGLEEKLANKNEKENEPIDDDGKEEEEEEEDTKSNKVNVNKFALSSFIYFSLFIQTNNLIGSSELRFNHLPMVYTHFYMLLKLVPSVIRFLSMTSSEVCLAKGLFVCDFYMTKIDSNSLESGILEINSLIELVEVLFKTIIYSNFETIRKQTIKTARLFFNCLNRQGRFEFLKYFLNNYHSDETMNNYLSSYLVYLFKEEVNDCFSKNDSFYFCKSESDSNKNFNQLFSLIVNLRDHEKTDLIQESSKIIACLNMIRFILLRDKLNQTNIYKLVKANNYLACLERSIQLAKAHYELEQHNIKLGVNKSQSQQPSPKLNVATLANEQLNEPTDKDKLSAVGSALQTLDLIECLRVRINEIISENTQFA